MEQEANFIAYFKVLEDQVTVLKYDAAMGSVQTRLMVGGDSPSPPPAKSLQAKVPLMRTLPSSPNYADTVKPKNKPW